MNTIYLELRKLFASRQPSVKRFYMALEECSPEEQERWYRKACFIAMNNWNVLPVWYKTFLINLVKHDWQRFRDYIGETSILGNMPYPVEDKRFVRKVFGLLARLPVKEGQYASLNHIAFVLNMGFESERKVSYLANEISRGMMTPEELIELKELAIVDC